MDWNQALKNKAELDRLERALGNPNPVFTYTDGLPPPRAAYEREVIGIFSNIVTRSRPGISDAGCAGERQLYQFVRDHVKALQVAVRNYNASASVNQPIDWRRIQDALDDEIPDAEAFEERLSDARRGY